MIKEFIENNKKPIYLLISFVSFVAIKGFFYDTIWFNISNSLFSLICIALFAYLLDKTDFIGIYRNSQCKLLSLVFSVAYSIMLIVGNEIYFDGYIGFSLTFYLEIILLVLPINVCILIFFNFLDRIEPKEKSISKHGYLIMFIIAAALLIAVLFFIWPGINYFDCIWEFEMYHNGVYNANHPFLHIITYNVILEICYKIFGTYNAGIGVYNIIQILLYSYTVVSILRFLNKKGIERKFILLLYVILLINPVLELNMMTTSKDGVFTCFFILSIVSFLENEANNKFGWKFFTYSVLACLFRNNALYAYIVFLIIVLFLNFKDKKSYLNLLIIITVYIFNIVTANVFDIQTVASREMLGIPLQQIARLYNKNSDFYTKEEKEFLYEIITDETLKNYNPYTVDKIKFDINDDALENNKTEFLKLWLKKGIEHPTIYIEAFLENTIYAWYPNSVLYYEGDIYGVNRALNANAELVQTVTYPPADPCYGDLYGNAVADYFVQVSHYSLLNKIPVLSSLVSLGSQTYIALLFVLYLLVRRNNLLFILLPMLYFGSCLLAPVTFARYYLFMYILAPSFLIYMLGAKRKIKNE